MLASLRARDFRIFETLDLDLDPGLNIVYGPNAQGKTSLLEAVYLLSTGKVLRGTRDVEAVRHGTDHARVEGDLGEVGTTLGVEIPAVGRKRATLNGAGLPRASDLLGRLPCVCFTADDANLVRGEPSDRREFFDVALSQLYPRYFRDLAAYKRAMEQRNALLRHAREGFVAPEQFEVWEAEMITHGEAMRATRAEYLRDLEHEARGYVSELSGEDFSVETVVKDQRPMKDWYTFHRSEDIARGATQAGPHRDDWTWAIAGKDGKRYGSQGQQRTLAIALRVASLKVAQRVLGIAPLLLLDDIFAELDQSRQNRLIEIALAHEGQVVLTCTEIELAGPDLIARAQRVRVSSGTVRVD